MLKAVLRGLTLALLSIGLWESAYSFNGLDANHFTNLQNLNPQALQLGLQAYQCALARHEVHNPLLSIVDYSLPSNAKRLWVIDPIHHKVLFHLFVSHGEESGNLYAQEFSNSVNSHESSLGVYLTANSYNGEHGYSLRLLGLEPGVNDNAQKRDIVIHSGWYANDNFVQHYAQAGHSWGCFVINQPMVKEVIDTLKGSSLLFVYAPQENHDPYVTQCSAPLNNNYTGEQLVERHSIFEHRT